MATIPSLPFTGTQLHTALGDINTEVAAKAASSHTHTVSQISDINTADNLLMTAAERTKLGTVASSAAVTSVGGQTGVVLVSALRGTVRAVTESTSVTATDNNGWIVCTGTLTVTVPTGLTAPFSVGILVVSGTVTIAGSGLTVNKRSDQALTIATAYAQAVLVSWASDSWAATGGLDASS